MVNLYVLYMDKYGFKLLINDSSITCEEFKSICDSISELYGNDMYVIYEKLINMYGFKRADLQCVYSVDSSGLIE